MVNRIVVTGASGNIGTALLRRLAGTSVTGIVRRLPDVDAEPYKGADWVACDLSSADAPAVLAEAVAGADAVVHLAWAINPATDEPPMDTMNRIGLANTLRAVADAGVPHLVCASSVAAYGPADRWQSIDEDWPRDGVPGSGYSQGKADLEQRLDEFADRHPEVTVARVRPCAVVQYDAGGEFDRWLLSPLFPVRALGHPWLPMPFWQGLRAQLVHAADVADAIALILERHAAGAFNLAGDGVLDARHLAGRMGGTRLPVPYRLLSAGAWLTWRLGLQPVHPSWLRLADLAPLVDTGRAKAELGWEPRYDALAAVADLVAGMRSGSGTASPALAAGASRRITFGRPTHQRQ